MSFFNYVTYDIPELSETRIIKCTTPIIVVINDDEYGPSEVTLLTKILGSVNQNMDKVQVTPIVRNTQIRIQTSPLSAEAAGQDTRTEEHLVLVFGISPSQCGLQVDQSLYHRIKINTCTFIFSDSLTSLPANAEGRRALWMVLKEYYNIA